MSKSSLELKLREAGVNIEDDGGFFKGGFALEDGRTQMFLIDYDADDLMCHQEYDFMSFVGPADDASAVKAACEMAGKNKRGGIVIIGGMICLKYEVGVDWDGDVMAANLQSLCQAADKIEAATVGGDAL
jgi:hypothetical protein